MNEPDLWMLVRHLANALDEGGLTREERIDSASARFSQLPPTVRRELLTMLRRTALDLFDLLPVVAAAENASHEQRRRRGEVA